MELRQLRAFAEVAARLHFGQAAQALHVSQPALSQRIQQLERELNVRLLTRNSRQVGLTRAGDILLPYARRMIEEEDHGLGAIRAAAGGLAGRVRVAYYTAGDPMLATHLVAHFRREYPEVAVEVS